MKEGGERKKEKKGGQTNAFSSGNKTRHFFCNGYGNYDVVGQRSLQGSMLWGLDELTSMKTVTEWCSHWSVAYDHVIRQQLGSSSKLFPEQSLTPSHKMDWGNHAVSHSTGLKNLWRFLNKEEHDIKLLKLLKLLGDSTQVIIFSTVFHIFNMLSVDMRNEDYLMIM